ncbi:MAG: hypothetical protein IKV15_05970 [Bacteroidaceae bacterium]|nr:hypothetical protein [Bacteroidaceae bacterium]
MTEQELKEVFELLEAQGLRPKLYDTPVPFYDEHVPCGRPNELGDTVPDGYVMLPHGLPGVESIFGLSVSGDSMVGVGIEDGDRLDVLSTSVVRDGDIVVVMIDGRCMVKSFITDEKGQRWLVPRNKKYRPKRLTEKDDVRILGRVVGVHKPEPKDSYRDLIREVHAEELREAEERDVSDVPVEEVVRRVAPMVAMGRQWYAVYRALVDKRGWGKYDVQGFVDMVARVVPEHGHLPSTKELNRMMVDSFASSVALWDEHEAPVTGERFKAYLRIAKATMEIWNDYIV